MWSPSKNSLVVDLNLFRGLPELASGLKKVQHDMLHCYIEFIKSPLIPSVASRTDLFQRGRFPCIPLFGKEGLRGDFIEH